VSGSSQFSVVSFDSKQVSFQEKAFRERFQKRRFGVPLQAFLNGSFETPLFFPKLKTEYCELNTVLLLLLRRILLLQPLQRLLGFRRELAAGRNLQVLLVILYGLGVLALSVENLRKAVGCDRVTGFVFQRFPESAFSGAIVLALLVKLSDLDIFLRLMRIPGVEFRHIADIAARMSGRIVPGRRDIDLRLLAGALVIANIRS